MLVCLTTRQKYYKNVDNFTLICIIQKLNSAVSGNRSVFLEGMSTVPDTERAESDNPITAKELSLRLAS